MKQRNTDNYTLSITLIAALGGFLFGFDMAVVSGIIEPIKLQYNLSASQEGFFVSCALLGCIVGVAISGYLSDKLGRKKVLFFASILFLISAIGFSFSQTYPLIIFFRILAGMGVGVASNISPLYISEIAPAKKRGSLVAYYQLAITVGILVAYVSNLFIQKYAITHAGEQNSTLNWLFISEVWRGMFLVGVIPSTVFGLLLNMIPESPRWLIQRGKEKKALDILTKFNDNEQAHLELAAIKKSADNNSGGIKELLKMPLSKLLAMSMILTTLSQFSGINGVIFYGPTILKSAGIVTNDALFYQVILGTAIMLFTFIAILKVDTLGRRPLYMIGSLGATIALILIGSCFLMETSGWLMLASIILFLMFFSFSLGPLKFIVATEIFPSNVRGIALSISIMTMWVADWLVNLLFPVMRDGLGIANTFFVFSFFCFVTFVYVKRNLVETKGKILEDINFNETING